jgi:hypothetical protein
MIKLQLAKIAIGMVSYYKSQGNAKNDGGCTKEITLGTFHDM